MLKATKRAQQRENAPSNGHTRIKGGGGEVVVARPPVVTVTSEQEGKDEPNEETVGVEVRKGWGHVGGGSQQHGPVDELQPGNVRELSGEEPEGNGQESTSNEAPLDGRVPGIILVTKDTSGSDGTPNDRG